MVTIKDIAKIAGVTYVTVSKALNGAPGVNAQTKQRILEIAEQLNYVPNLAAKRLANRRTNCIGLIWPAARGLFFYDLSLHIHAEAAKRGLHVLASMAPAEEAMRIFNQHVVDAVIYWSMGKLPLGFLKEAERFKGELLLLGGGEMEGAHSVAIDRAKAMYEAVKHLAELGHVRIAYAGTPGSDKQAGFMQGVAEFRLDYRPEYGLRLSDPDFARKLETMLGSKERPTAFVVDNQASSFELIKLLRQLHIRVPDDVSLVAYDDVKEMELLEAPLTTVGPPVRELAVRALDILVEAGQKSASEGKREFQHQCVQPVLTIRQSTKPAAG
jgi:LacI family transcriptional regulator